MSEEISPYYKPQLKTRVVMTFGMLGILAVFIIWLFAYLPTDQFILGISLFALYMAPGAGKESIIPVMMGFGYPWWLVLAGIVTIDMTLAVLISFNFDLLLKIPVLGQVLMFFTEKTNKILQKRPWIKGLSVGGLLIFMYVPFMGSSAIDTSIIGRLLSIHPKIILPIVFAGSILATLTMAFGARAIIDLWFVQPIYAVGAVAAVIAVGILIYIGWQKFTARRFPKKE
ncbi:MAG: small multi-drug export protein [Methanocorpusculum sp.]|uniref:small multi-drug export protein n=1 Tax=Methanocorpusculum sp. TaxID=2058474 RepID=UPI00271A4340|nr:small multi-drug export protein [Methanocorpusculum sp.]MDO9523776.1 small multi-drug export protein [Methanocorpusculum sp.]